VARLAEVQQMHKYSGMDNIQQAVFLAWNGVEAVDGKIEQTFCWWSVPVQVINI